MNLNVHLKLTTSTNRAIELLRSGWGVEDINYIYKGFVLIRHTDDLKIF